MQFNTQIYIHPDQIETQALGIGIFSDSLTEIAELINSSTNGSIRTILDKGFSADASKILILYQTSGIKTDLLILLGLGKKSDYSMDIYANAEETFIRACVENNIEHATSTLLLDPIIRSNIRNQARISAICGGKATYKYKATFNEKCKDQKPGTKKITQLVNESDYSEAEIGLQEGSSIAKGMDLAKNLGDLPSNICTPYYLCKTAEELGQKSEHIEVQIMDSKKLRELKMEAFLSVAKGSKQDAYLITLRYKNKKFSQRNQNPIVIVGKGVTFDSGGISIKPSTAMDEMKYDMCGAACVLGIFHALKSLRLSQEIIGVIGTCENLLDAESSKPGDVIKSMSGKTIEILNTDAEGRLILCDILTYVKSFNASTVIDVATLTGACVVALGHVNSGLFSRNEDLVKDLLIAGNQVMDNVWHMPLNEEYNKQLDSNFADIANIGGRSAGSITAACFLSSFVGSYKWAHLDIAGTAWNSGKNKGATGRPVPLLLQFLINQESKN